MPGKPRRPRYRPMPLAGPGTSFAPGRIRVSHNAFTRSKPRRPWRAAHRCGSNQSRRRPTRKKGQEMAGPVEQDNMLIEWDVAIAMDDGLILRADVFRPVAEGQWPVLLTYGPYAKGLAFQQGYPSAWQLMIANHPDVVRDSTGKYQNWEVVDPEKWVPHGYVCVRVDSRGTGRSPGHIDHFSPRETRDFYACIEWAGVQGWSNGRVGLNGVSYYG